MIKKMLYGDPMESLVFNPNGVIKWFDNTINGAFSSGKPISVMISKGVVVQGNACHSLWSKPESVLWVKKDGSKGVSRVLTYTQIDGYKDIWFAIGGLGISDMDLESEGFCEFDAINTYTKEMEHKDFSDVTRRTNHSVYGFNGNKLFGAIMYGNAQEIKSECALNGYTHVIMGDGGSWASCKTDDYELNLDKVQYSAVQMIGEVSNLKKQNEISLGVDFGHGTNTPGKGYLDFSEHYFNSEVGLMYIEEMIKLGFKADQFVKAQPAHSEEVYLTQRYRKYDNVDFYVSFHADAHNNHDVDGTSFYYWITSSKGYALAKCFAKHFKESVIDIDFKKVDEADTDPSDGTYDNMGILREPAAPGLLIEHGYMTNDHDRTELDKPSTQRIFAQTWAKASVDYLVSNNIMEAIEMPEEVITEDIEDYKTEIKRLKEIIAKAQANLSEV